MNLRSRVETFTFATLTTACLGIGISGAAQANEYPTHPIKLVVPFATGGATDNMGRLIAKRLAERLGQAIAVENRPGAGSQIGVTSIVNSKPDGYTLLFGNVDGLAIVPAMKKRAPYDPSKDLTPISMVAASSLVYASSSKTPVDSLDGLLKLAKEKPGNVRYGSAGNGSFLHLGVELLQASSGTQLLHVPYQGGGPMMQAVISGEVDLVLTTADFAKRYEESGHLRTLAQADSRRHPLLPNTPTTAEVGMKNLVAVAWFGVLGPANMPPAVVRRLDRELAAIMNDPLIDRELIQLGSKATYLDSSDFDAHIAKERQRWADIVRAAGIPLQD